MAYDIRSYRDKMSSKELIPFQAVIKETDLFILVDKKSYRDELKTIVEEVVWHHRKELEHYISQDPEFRTTFSPYLVSPGAPPIVVLMARAGNQAGVGPMASVAGAFAEIVGRELLNKVEEVIVENGGDIFLKITKTRKVSVLCPDSPFNNRLALEVKPKETPLGVCTSSGKVGPSYSSGKADAVVVISPSAPLADAAATALGNLVVEKEDVEKAVKKAGEIPGVKGVLIIKDDKLGIWGKIKIVPI